jgi:transposase
MAKRTKRAPKRSPRRAAPVAPGSVAHAAGGPLHSYTVGALPIINDLLARMRLEEFLQAYLPPEDPRSKLSAAKTLLVLLRNLLLSREPLYGLGEWAARYAPDLLGLSAAEVSWLNDDRAGRAADRLFLAEIPALVLAVVRHVVRQFQVGLDELHNDSTSVTVYGAYLTAAAEKRYLGRPTLAITFGHNKDHRPDLKQLLYILTVSSDGGVPVHFRVQNGNTTDDTTHRDTWELLCQLSGRKDFLYVADCKLATHDNMSYIAQRQGRFLSVLPRSRSEDAEFRRRVRDGQVTWRHLEDKTDEAGQVLDRSAVAQEPALTAEGFRLVWYHSTQKAALDAAARAAQIERTLKRLGELQQRLASPRTRYREAAKVQQAVEEILQACAAAECLRLTIVPREEERFRQQKAGRPGPATQYVKSTRTRFELNYEIDVTRMIEESQTDGVFPLVSNVVELSELELLHAYKRQPTIEKRFSQLKTDFAVAPVYLKEVRRVQALLSMYFFALLVEALLERELRQAMQRQAIEALPLYPEGRACRWPTARRLLDVFEPVQRHTLSRGKQPEEVIVTELTNLQRRLLKLLGLSVNGYGY